MTEELGRYKILENLGQGGFATVYRAHDTELDRQVALKELRQGLLPDDEWVKRFKREARTIARLNHPCIVTIYDVLEMGERLFIVMRLVDGPSLDSLIISQGRLPWSQALEIMTTIAEALDYAHGQGILHRDLKPANILLDPERGPQLSDFGLAKLASEAGSSVTAAGGIVGTPHYIAPEVWEGQGTSRQSDIYALGCILYEVATGEKLFEGESPPAVMMAHFRPLTLPDTWPEDVPSGVVKVLKTALAKQPSDRYASAGELTEALTKLPEDKLAGPDHAPEEVHPTSVVGRVMQQQIRFCTAPDGVRIAYATVGQGPALVRAATYLTHLEYDWNSPVHRHWLEGLARHHTLVRYDQRGCGLSDWDAEEFSLNADVQDMEMVVDALGLDKFSLMGVSQSGPVATAYAVRHPEKVSHLILYGTFARGFLKRNPTPEQIEEAEVYLNLIKLGWGRDNPAFRQVFSTTFLPEGTPEQISWFNDLQRVSTSPENALRRDSASYNLDVTDLAPRVSVPTLVIHPRNDAAVPFEQGRKLAALIPNARFVSLESNNHLLLSNEPAWSRFLDEVHRFLGVESFPLIL